MRTFFKVRQKNYWSNSFREFTLLSHSCKYISTIIIVYLSCVHCMNSNNNCTTEQFSCRSEYGECIALNWMCDDNPDCTDASDEADCNGTCRSDEFSCINNHCIQQRWVCDHDNDCGDASDEENCELFTCRPDEDFTCTENYCITANWRCDGDYDCPDRSDESNCDIYNMNQYPIHCLNHEVACADRITCINKNWLCDGDEDCSDGSDEFLQKCSYLKCRGDQYQCTDHTCIPGHSFCDGLNDCIDKSDEENCSDSSKGCDKFEEFECSKGFCVPNKVLCDKKQDCFEWQDENNSLCGIDECSNNNGGCAQICSDLPIGYHCLCQKGYELINNQTCKDIDECSKPGSCSQLCTNEEGSFKCSCTDGYLSDPRNPTRCKASEGHASLIFTRRHDIRKVALDRKDMTALVNNTKMATALDFVFRTGMIFWSDISERKIYKSPIDEGNDRISVIDGELTASDGLAVDWLYNHIYWTDAEKNTIEISNFDGTMRKTIISDYIQEPRSIALNPLDGWMYWTDWGEQARIEKSGMDGAHRSILIGKDIMWPNGLTLDLISRQIYWVDAKLHIISSCDYNGSNRRTVLYSKEKLGHPFSITMFEDYVYWTDWGEETIFRANKFDGLDIEAVTPQRSLQHPMVVHVYHPYKQPDGINQCQSLNGHCSHLCLPSPMINSKSPLLSCACPEGLMLSFDGLTCVENENTVAIPSNVKSVDITYNLGVITSIVAGVLFLGGMSSSLMVITYYRCYSHHNWMNMNFDNPVYKKEKDDQFNYKRHMHSNSKDLHDRVSSSLSRGTH